MKPYKVGLGIIALLVLVSAAWLGRAGAVQAHAGVELRAARHPRLLPSLPGALVGTPRAAHMEAELLDGLNARRADALIAPLTPDARLSAVARERSADMVARDYFAHITPDGSDVYAMLDARGITAYLAGENLARNNWGDAESPAHVVAGFMASQPHRMNVLDSAFRRVGIGVAIGPGGMKVYTVLFAGN